MLLGEVICCLLAGQFEAHKVSDADVRASFDGATLLAASVWSGGCVRTRTVLIPPGEPVQLAEPVKAHVYIEVAGKRIRSENRITLPEGWWCLPDVDEDQ